MNSSDPRPAVVRKLEVQQRALSWASAGIWVGVLGVLAVLAVLELNGGFGDRGGPDRVAVYGLILGIVVLVSALTWRLAGQAARRLNPIIDTVRQRLPERLPLRSTPIVTLQGRLFRDQGDDAVYAFQIPRYSRFGATGAPTIDVWHEVGESRVVGNDNGYVATGARLENAQLDRALRRANVAWFGLALFSAGLFAGVIAVNTLVAGSAAPPPILADHAGQGNRVVAPEAQATPRDPPQDPEQFALVMGIVGTLATGTLVGLAEWQRRLGRRFRAENGRTASTRIRQDP